MCKKIFLIHVFFLCITFALSACHSRKPADTSQASPHAFASLTPVFFDVDKADIKDATPIDANAGWLMSNTDKVVVLEGHCDERGDRNYNLKLGDLRARAVMGALLSRGVKADQLIIVSYGKDRPLEPGRQNWDKNRRVQLVVR